MRSNPPVWVQAQIPFLPLPVPLPLRQRELGQAPLPSSFLQPALLLPRQLAQVPLPSSLLQPVPLLPRDHLHLQAVLEGLMAKDREQRYPNTQTLLDDLG